MPARADYKICKCIVCLESNNEGCRINTQDWASHQRLLRNRLDRSREDLPPPDPPQLPDPENEVEMEEEKISQLVFKLTLNDELASSASSDPLWSRSEETLKPPSLNQVSTALSDPAEMISSLETIINSSFAEAGKRNPVQSPYMGALKQPSIFRAIIRPVKSVIERQIEKASSHISSIRAKNRLNGSEKSVSDLKEKITSSPTYDHATQRLLESSLAAIRCEVQSTKRDVPIIRDIRTKLLAELDEIEKVLTGRRDAEEEGSDMTLMTFDTGLSHGIVSP